MSLGGGAGGGGSGRASGRKSWPGMPAWRAGNNPLGITIDGMNPYQYNRAHAGDTTRSKSTKTKSVTSSVYGERGKPPARKSLTGDTLNFAGT